MVDGVAEPGFGAVTIADSIVASGDGGWVHLGPYVAEFLSSNGYFVVGFDSKAYLSSFTRNGTTLTTTDVPEDFAALLDYAATGASTRPVLIGVSEGAGLSVLAATQDAVKAKALGWPSGCRTRTSWAGASATP